MSVQGKPAQSEGSIRSCVQACRTHVHMYTATCKLIMKELGIFSHKFTLKGKVGKCFVMQWTLNKKVIILILEFLSNYFTLSDLSVIRWWSVRHPKLKQLQLYICLHTLIAVKLNGFAAFYTAKSRFEICTSYTTSLDGER